MFLYAKKDEANNEGERSAVINLYLDDSQTRKTQIVSTFSLTTSSMEIAESNNSEIIHPNHNTIYGIENR